MRRRLVPVVVVGALVAGLAAALAPPAQAKHPRPHLQVEPSVPGHRAASVKAARPVHTTPNPTRASWPRAGHSSVTLSPRAARGAPLTRAGKLPVWVNRTASVDVLDHRAATEAGVSGLLMRLHAAAGRTSVRVSYADFRDAYGGDWAARLRLVQLPACAATTPQLAGCRKGRPLPTTNDAAAATATADVAAGGVVALDAAPSGSTGTYTATSMSDAGKWAVSTQSGAFSYSYPFTVPSVPGDLEPSPALTYSSSAVDGQTSATNNQPSWIGNGWDLSAGFIERRYDSCYDDASAKTGDLCWAYDNATLSLDGQSTPLVPAGGDVWKQKNDDGTLVKHLTGKSNGARNGEYWEVIDTDGTQYYFGRTTTSAWTVPVFGDDSGEPCYNASFAAAHCTQAYRWNLDYVVDVHGNSMTYKYATETNHYGMNRGASTVPYIRGGELAEIDYGTRDGEAGTAPARVVFTAADRCTSNCSTHTATYWADTPWDQSCTSACTTKTSPTFWGTKRLSAVTTQVWNGHSYDDVDGWTLDQSYPDPGDGSGKAMWLAAISHAGLVGDGSVAVPKVTFDYAAANLQTYPNRIDSSTDGLPPMDKFRIHTIHNESGGLISVEYQPSDCSPTKLPTPDDNTMRCYPVHWTPDGVGEIDDWFAKYTVAQIKQTDLVGDSRPQVTSYEYLGGAAWHYDDNALVPQKRRTWSDWRGYEKVRVREGDPASDPGRPQSLTQYQYFRGMDGDLRANGSTRAASVVDSQNTSLPDSDEYAGRQREAITYDGDAIVDSTIDTPWHHGPTASQRPPTTVGPLEAWTVGTSRSVVRTALGPDSWRVTQTDTTLDNYGLPTKVDDHGDLGTTKDDRCTTTSYARNTDKNILDLPSQVTSVGVACGSTPSFPDDAISDTRTYYDNGALGAAPSHGDATRKEEVSSYSGPTPNYVATDRSEYDRYGRVTSSTDALNRTTVTGYTDSDGLSTKVVVTNPLKQTTTTTYDPARHLPLTTVDGGGRTTTQSYDALGRLLEVRLPGRPAAPALPDLSFAYSVSNTAASWTRTSRLLPTGKDTADSYVLYDGFLRERQTQAPAHGAAADDGPQPLGRDIVDTVYDSRGLAWKVSSPYFNSTPPSGALQETAWTDIPQSTESRYDGAERLTDAITVHYKAEVARTSTAYHGDHVDVTKTPADGATQTSTYTDVRGQVTKLLQYHGAQPTGPADTTSYGYTKAGELETIEDATGDRWTYNYDVRGRKTSTSDPDAGTSTMTYDDAGQLLTSTDARKQTLAYDYDPLGRKTEEHSGSSTGTLLASWRYDSLPDGTPAVGDQTASTRYVHGAAYTVAVTGYDTSNRPLGQKITIPDGETGLTGSYVTTTSYLADGSPDTTVLPKLGDLPSEYLIYDYDAFGQPSTMSGDDDYVTDTRYSQQNAMTFLQNGRGDSAVWQTYRHDVSTQRLTDSIIQRPTGPADVDHEQYGYDVWGNVTSQTDSLTAAATDRQCFRYDYLQRLTDAWTTSAGDCSGVAGSALGGPEPYWSSYAYNLLGDRTTQTQHGVGGGGDTVNTYHYTKPDQSHALTSVTTTGPAGDHTASYDYDAAGDTISRPGPDGSAETLTWDEEDHLAAAGSGSSYVYDADGNRLITHDASGATLFLPGGELHVDKDGNNAHGTRYYSYAGLSIGVRTAAGLSWTAGDNHGTSDLAIDATTLRPTKRRLDPFGNPRDDGAFPGDRGFVGGVDDASTGLTHLGARDYDAATGRFLSVDPLLDTSNPQQLDPYEYAYNNPATASDPSGLIGACPDGACGKVDRPGDHRSHGGRNCSSSTCVHNRQASSSRHAGSQTQQFNNEDIWQANAAANEYKRAQDAINQEIAENAARLRQQQEEASKNHCGKLKIACDVIGVNDVINCVSHPNVGDCVNAAIDVASVAAPALKGAKAVEVVDEGVNLAGKAEHGVAAEEGTSKAATCLNSFTGDTPVTMSDGSEKPIKDVKVHDKVLATDPETGRTEAEPVVRLIRHSGPHRMVLINIGDGSVLDATDGHPVWDATSGRFTDASMLRVGDQIKTSNGALITVTGLTIYRASLTAYNLQIGEIHTYYAGSTPILVHNSCGPAFRSDTSHIFRNAPGHLAQDTPQNRALLQDAVDPANLISTNKWGISTYRTLLPNGQQVWVEVRNGTEITNGGVNVIPRK